MAEVFSLLSNLGSYNLQKRLLAATNIFQLYINQNKCNDKLYLGDVATSTKSVVQGNQDYILKRLIKGLNTNNPSSRMGFSCALTMILQSQESSVIRENIYKQLDAHVLSSKPDSKEEATAFDIGKIFLLLSLTKSGALEKLLPQQRAKCVSAVVELYPESSLVDLVAYSLAQAITQMTCDEFRELIFMKLEKYFALSWESVTSNALLIMLKGILIHKKAIGKSFLQTHYQCKKLFLRRNFERILHTIFSFGQQREKSALHELCVVVLEKLVETPEELIDFIKMACSRSCIPTSSSQDKALVFQMIHWILKNIESIPEESCEALITGMFDETVSGQLHLQLSRKDSVLHNFTVQLFSSGLLLNPDIPDYIKCLVFKTVCNHEKLLCFDMDVPGNCKFSQIFGVIPREALYEFVLRLKTEFQNLLSSQIHSDDDDVRITTQINMKSLNFISQELRILATSRKFSHKDVCEILVFFLDHSVFTDDAMSISCRQSAQSCFFKVLDHLSNEKRRRKNHYTKILSSISRSILAKLEGQKTASLKGNASGLISRSLAHGLDLLESSGTDGLSWGFSLVYLHLGFFLLSGEAKLFASILDDVDECFKRAKSLSLSKDEDDVDLMWSDVLLDSLLNLLSHQSHLLRSVVKLVLMQVGQFVTTKSIDVLEEILLSPAVEKSDSNGLLEFDSGEDDDAADSDNSGGSDAGSDEEEVSESDISMDEGEEDVESEFRTSVKSALGDAGIKSDVEEDPSDLSDDAMEKIDQALVMAFKARKRSSRKEVNLKRRSVMQMKLRCLDVVEVLFEQCVDLNCRLKLLLCLGKFIQSSASGHFGPGDEREHALNRSISLLQQFKKVKHAETENATSTTVSSFIEEGVSLVFALVQKSACPAKIVDAASTLVSNFHAISAKSLIAALTNHFNGALSATVKFQLNISLSVKIFQTFPQLLLPLRKTVLEFLRSTQTKTFHKALVLQLVSSFFCSRSSVDSVQKLSPKDAKICSEFSENLHLTLCGLIEKEIKSGSSTKFLVEALNTETALLRYKASLYQSLPDSIVNFAIEKRSIKSGNSDLRRVLNRFLTLHVNLKKALSQVNGSAVSAT